MCGGVHYGEVEGLVSVERCFVCGRAHYREACWCQALPGGVWGIEGLGGTLNTQLHRLGPSCSHFKPNLSTSKVSLASTLFISSHYSKGSDRMQCVQFWNGNDRYTQ